MIIFIESFYLGLWSTQGQTSQWHVTTQPNFITKPKPQQSDKITPLWTKPKSTKKPIVSGEIPMGYQTLQDLNKQQASNSTKPKPQVVFFCHTI